MSDTIDDLLRFDALDEAEKITGQPYKRDEGTSALGLLMHMENAGIKERALRAAGDTPFGCPLPEYLGVCRSIGFETLLEIPFLSPSSQVTERLMVMWSKSGYLLVFDTFSWPDPQAAVNSGNVYYNLTLPEEDWGNIVSGGHYTKNGVWAGDHDCREALRHKVNSLNPYVIPEWKACPSLYLMHHGDKDKWDRHKDITDERLAMCGEVGQMILRLREPTE